MSEWHNHDCYMATEILRIGKPSVHNYCSFAVHMISNSPPHQVTIAHPIYARRDENIYKDFGTDDYKPIPCKLLCLPTSRRHSPPQGEKARIVKIQEAIVPFPPPHAYLINFGADPPLVSAGLELWELGAESRCEIGCLVHHPMRLLGKTHVSKGGLGLRNTTGPIFRGLPQVSRR